jgi:alkylhydroperoxidase/carboxymuconolactone decarboxylase family protein YurZ
MAHNTNMATDLPSSLNVFKEDYPEVWTAFEALGEKCHTAGPLDDRTRRLVKLAIAVGAQHEGAVHSAVRQALDAGISREEIMHVTVLAVTTLGWPHAHAAVTWVRDVVSGRSV